MNNPTEHLLTGLHGSEYKLFYKPAGRSNSGATTYIRFYVIYLNTPVNVSLLISQVLDLNFNKDRESIQWKWKRDKNDFRPEVWISGKLSEKLYGDRRKLSLKQLKSEE